MALPASSQLPDEIIKEILAPVLYVSDEAFSDMSANSNPFAKYDLSTSTILVVCKSWLRVATPLLYETVVLRSKAQAQALSGALKRNEQFGQFIEKLRIEGGYGTFVGEILRRSPFLSELWISTTLYSNESVAGYLKGFQAVNLRRLIVVDNHLKTSAIRKKVYEGEAVRHAWTNLTYFEINGADWRSERLVPLVNSLSEASQLEYLTFHPTCEIAEPVIRLATIPNLKQIRVISRHGGKPTIQKLQNAHYVSELEKLMRDDRGLYDKVVYESAKKDGSFGFDFAVFLSDSDSDDSLPETQTNVHKKDEDVLPAPLDPNWRPLVGASDMGRKEILSCILRHAASLSEQGTSSIRRQELATPFLYQAPILTGPKGFSRCSNLVLVSEARHLHALEKGDEIQNDTMPIPYQWSNFESGLRYQPRPQCSHRTFKELRWYPSASSPQHGTSFAQESESIHEGVKRTGATSRAAFESVGDLTKLDVSAGRFPRDAFPHLERLVVDPDCTINKVFLYALCSAKLPTLNWLRIGGDFPMLGRDPSIEKFLSVHGSKLTYLESTARLGGSFAYCTNVRVWLAIYSDGRGSDDDFLCLDADNLNPDPDVTYALNSIMISSYRFGLSEAEALLNMDLSRLTNLEKIHDDHLEWPKSQRGIDKSTWVPVAEAMVERWNIKFADTGELPGFLV
ncbi:hypothetical protein BKA70DRAFT_1400209 [Coprinopsis sp. MPI-PUGE-AT-0042]|nr:hypothetical protein BKA70DRAFT_1400209 [Coprinopsis sp. MPI-PUGE-AT-0042]